MGMRALAVVSVLASVALFERIVLGVYGDEACVRLGACLFAVAAVGDVWSGRLTFALGVDAGAGVRICARPRTAARGGAGGGDVRGGEPGRGRAAGAGRAVVCARAARPDGPAGGRRAGGAGGGAGAGAVPGRRVRAVSGDVVRGHGDRRGRVPVGAAARSERNRVLRVGAVVYLVACLLCVVVQTPMGSNIERYGVLLAGPLLLCGLAGGGARRRAHGGAAWTQVRSRARRTPRAAWSWRCAWRWCGSCGGRCARRGRSRGRRRRGRPTMRRSSATWRAHGAGLERVEVPLTRSHWEAAMLAPSVSLARGWEKQLEERYDSALLGSGLSAGEYRAWLQREAVAYVALPDVPLDPSSAREGQLIRGGAAVPEAGVREQALARVCGPRRDAAAGRAGAADGARERHVRAVRRRCRGGCWCECITPATTRSSRGVVAWRARRGVGRTCGPARRARSWSARGSRWVGHWGWTAPVTEVCGGTGSGSGGAIVRADANRSRMAPIPSRRRPTPKSVGGRDP